jgi:hypothetical protein
MEKTRDILSLRHWCIRKCGHGLPVSEICTALQIFSIPIGKAFFATDSAVCESLFFSTVQTRLGEGYARITAIRSESFFVL